MAFNQFLDFDPFFIRIIFGFDLILDCFRQKLKKGLKAALYHSVRQERDSVLAIFLEEIFFTETLCGLNGF